MVKCNMTPAEQKMSLELFPYCPSGEELERSKAYFEEFLFYDTWGRRNFREYFCPNCGRFEIEGPWHRDVYVDNPFDHHHGDAVHCPRCEADLTLICLGRMRTMKSLTRWENIAFIREADGVLTVSAGRACMRYSHDDLRPDPEYYEKARYVVEPGKRQMWRKVNWWENSHVAGETWQPTKSFTEPFPRTHWYGGSIISGEISFVGAEHIQNTSMRYCQIHEFFDAVYDGSIYDGTGDAPMRGPIMYLGEYSAKPQIEMLVKLGHVDVVKELLENGGVDQKLVNWRAKTPAAFFRMTKSEYKTFRQFDGTMKELKRWREDGDVGMDLREYMSACAFLGSERHTFFTKCQALKLPCKKALAWAKEQAPLGDNGAYTVRLWADYLDMAEKLEREMTFRRNVLPENLRAEHDAAVELLERIEVQKEKGEYSKRYKKLQKIYAYSDGELSIIVPPNASSIKREGQTLKHCVGGYAERHIKGATTILFLRKTENIHTPYVTIEINDANFAIRQVHGYRNEGEGAENPRERHKDFFDNWLEWLKRGSPRARNGKPKKLKMKREETAA